ncbi:MAG: FAD-dependent oxidoreductase [Nanoarchaeota archaeon]|nr:FAD-dependent oxidoreductase [Nanoarchaeota archaeon]
MKRLVIIGGGFAGTHIAKKLENKFEVTLIDNKDYFEFTPGVLRTIVEPLHIKKIQSLHTNYLKKAKVILGRVTNLTDKEVYSNNKKIPFDYLVICSGSSYNLPFKEKDVVIAIRAKHLRNYHHELVKAHKILIIGGGLVGTEITGEICWKYGRKKEITIVHSEERLIERNPLAASKYAKRFLEKYGVKIFFNEKIISNKGKKFTTDKGNHFKCDLAFLCTGIKPNYEFLVKNLKSILNGKNQVKVNEYLQAEGYENIFAAGDITSWEEEKTAQHAMLQAITVIKNLSAISKAETLTKYHSRPTILVISLGKYDGLFTYKGLTIHGFIPAFMKAAIERWKMVTYK